jgi:hypothetical protein
MLMKARHTQSTRGLLMTFTRRPTSRWFRSRIGRPSCWSPIALLALLLTGPGLGGCGGSGGRSGHPDAPLACPPFPSDTDAAPDSRRDEDAANDGEPSVALDAAAELLVPISDTATLDAAAFSALADAEDDAADQATGDDASPCEDVPGEGAAAAVDSALDDADGHGAPRARAILVSVDGLGAYYLRQQLSLGTLPNFAALARAGASTLNARADYAYTVTLPNHTSMITGLPVSADPDLPATAYHGWTINGQVPSTMTLHNAGNPNLAYVASVFDVVHDHGGSTCLYSGKAKFSLFANSYNGRNGAPDVVPPDDGRNKIDRVSILDLDTESLIASVEADLSGSVCDFAFVHIADPDSVGHGSGWGSDAWLVALHSVDAWLGRLAAFVDPSRTPEPFYLIVTADHGGEGFDHGDASKAIDYTIPFFLAGPGIPANTDLYALTGPDRADPGVTRPRYSEPLQPVRNTDAANLVTRLMGLPAVPGSFMHDLLR